MSEQWTVDKETFDRLVKEETDSRKIHEYGDEVDMLWGLGAVVELSQKDIDALKSGKFMAISVADEYVMLLRRKNEQGH